MINKKMDKKGQLAIFIIIAVVIVAGVVLVFIFRDSLFNRANTGEFSEVYGYFDECVKGKTIDGLKIAGLQGGYIDVPEFEAGNQFSPFSNQLDFLGNPVPYWYYVSGNNVIKEQVLSKTEIEKQLQNFLDLEIRDCDFEEFVDQGFIINNSVPKTSVKIYDDRVDVSVNMKLSVSREDSSSIKQNHDIRVDSRFGEFYDIARNIYDKEKSNGFLENFSVDILYNYAPVTGTELSCKPIVWNPQEVSDGIKEGLSANVANLKVKGDYYKLNSKENSYFVINNVDISGKSKDIGVNFMYDSSWPTRVEIWPVDGSLMVAKPVGLEQGLGILGFCYVSYHYVYDVYYPILVQVYDGNEVFQFPVSVVIDKSTPRQAITDSENGLISQENTIQQICNYKNTNVDVYTYDNELNPVEANLDFVCLEAECSIGQTKISGNDAVLSTKFPQCINGKIIAQAEGFVPAEYILDTNTRTTANILLDKLYDKDVKIYVDGRLLSDSGVGNGLILISFDSEKNSQNVVYPNNKDVKLSEGYYNISVQIFSGSSLVVPASSSRQCVSVPSPGLLGFFGKTSEQCFNVDIPSQTLDNALSGGGKSSEYILEDDLKNSNSIDVYVKSLPSPSSLDQIQRNYDLYEANSVEVRFT